MFNGGNLAGSAPAYPIPDYLNERIQAEYNSGYSLIPASRRPLVVDEVISAGTDFSNVAGALYKNVSNHMAGDMPTGGHAAFVDGHVAWRKFQRGSFPSQADNLDYFTPKTAGGSPAFWF